MKKMSEPIVFFGSGPVAAQSLSLLAKDFSIETVVTKPRLAHHTGEVPVLDVVEKLQIPLKTVSNKSELDQLVDQRPFQSKLGVLIDFGILVSQKVIDYFPLGIINSHFSILPEWRGADPISFAVLSGQDQTGVSLMFLVAAMDEGPLLAYGEQRLEPDITTPELTQKLILLSDALLKHELPKILTGENPAGAPQTITGRTTSYSRKLTKEDGILDWSKPAEQLEREIRAFAGWPKSRTHFGTIDAIVTKARVKDVSGKSGDRLIIDKLPAIYCAKRALVIERLKPAGKQEMSGEAFLAGYKQQFLR